MKTDSSDGTAEECGCQECLEAQGVSESTGTAGSIQFKKAAELGQLYTRLDLMRAQAMDSASLLGEHLEQGEIEDLGYISKIANRLIASVLLKADKMRR